MNGTVLVVVVLLGMLAATAMVGWWAWQEIGDVQIGIHGMIALIAGATATFLLGVGLMWLVYYSNRRGYDDRAGKDF